MSRTTLVSLKSDASVRCNWRRWACKMHACYALDNICAWSNSIGLSGHFASAFTHDAGYYCHEAEPRTGSQKRPINKRRYSLKRCSRAEGNVRAACRWLNGPRLIVYNSEIGPDREFLKEIQVLIIATLPALFRWRVNHSMRRVIEICTIVLKQSIFSGFCLYCLVNLCFTILHLI